jgi:hypothetical protein
MKKLVLFTEKSALFNPKKSVLFIKKLVQKLDSAFFPLQSNFLNTGWGAPKQPGTRTTSRKQVRQCFWPLPFTDTDEIMRHYKLVSSTQKG